MERSQHDVKLLAWKVLGTTQNFMYNVLGMTKNCLRKTEYITRATLSPKWLSTKLMCWKLQPLLQRAYNSRKFLLRYILGPNYDLPGTAWDLSRRSLQLIFFPQVVFWSPCFTFFFLSSSLKDATTTAHIRYADASTTKKERTQRPASKTSIQTLSLHSDYLFSNHEPTSMSPGNIAATPNRTRTTRLGISAPPRNTRWDHLALSKSYNISLGTVLFSDLSIINSFFHSTPMRRDKSATPQVRLYVARQSFRNFRPLLSTGPEQHLFCKSCVETINSTTSVSETFSSDFGFETRQIRRSCVEIFTPQLKRLGPGHFAKYASISYYSANYALRPRALPKFSDFSRQHESIYVSISQIYATRFSGKVSSTLLQRHVNRKLSCTFRHLLRYRLMAPVVKRQDIYSAIHLLRSLHFPSNGISLGSTISPATVRRAWYRVYTNVGHPDHPSTWIIHHKLLPRHLSSSRRRMQVFHVYVIVLYRLLLLLQGLDYKSSHTR